MKSIWCLFLCFFIALSCRKAQEIDIVLPSYSNKLMVECYLEPGQGYRLLLTESVSYLEPEIARPVFDALVTITYKNKMDTLLLNNLLLNISDSVKVYNFINSKVVVPEDYESEFQLYIKDNKGRVVTGTTKIAPKLNLDSAKVMLENGERSVFAYIDDDQDKLLHYRFMVFTGSNKGSETQSSITDNQQLKFSPFIFGNKEQIIFKSKSDFFLDKDGKLINQVAIRAMVINKDYYDFLTSVRNAKSANGNPFAQPASILSNINGGVGIFTGFSPVYKQLKVAN
ncbi:MAG: DUF4249 domain-containing protein [Cytophagales bacterium]|nr:MAG: DUF4249 domain-containing protein [Cytophagales bacterium]